MRDYDIRPERTELHRTEIGSVTVAIYHVAFGVRVAVFPGDVPFDEAFDRIRASLVDGSVPVKH